MGAGVRPLSDGYRPLVFQHVKGGEAAPCMPAECKDCAFAKGGSPEQSDTRTWAAVLMTVDSGTGFYCHQGMEMQGGAYKPALDENGRPLGARLCAGWIAMRKQFLAVRRADLEDELVGLLIDRPDVVRATMFAVVLSTVRG